MPRTNRAQHTHTHTHTRKRTLHGKAAHQEARQQLPGPQPTRNNNNNNNYYDKRRCLFDHNSLVEQRNRCMQPLRSAHTPEHPSTNTHTRRQTINWQKPQVCQQQNQNHRCGLGVDLGGTPAQHIRLPGPFVLVLCVGLTALRECHRPHGVVQEHLEQLARPIRLRSWLHRRNELHLRC